MKNNIKEILNLKHISINELAKLIDKDYPTTHALVNRESLNTTKLDTLVKVSEVLDVDIQMLYGEEKAKEVRVLRLYNAKYAGGLAVEALEKYKMEVEQGIKEKLGRIATLTYKYTSDIDITGVSDEVELEIKIGSKKDDKDRYTINLTTTSSQFIFDYDLVNMIKLAISEFEKGNYNSIEHAWENLSYEGYNHSNVELRKS